MKSGYRLSIRAILSLGLMTCAQMAIAYDIRQAAAETGLSARMIEAIALEESRRAEVGTGGQPWAWTLNANQQPMYFDSRQEAEQALRELHRSGMRNIDVGLFQVNIRWNGDLVRDPVLLLDPAINLWAFTQVIIECQTRVGREVRRVLACYHAGSDKRPHGLEYARRVISTYRNLRWGY